MKEYLLFIYNFYEYYFLALTGIIGSIVALYFCKKKLVHSMEKAIALFGIIAENGLIATWMMHHSIKQIAGIPQPFLSAFLLKCLFMFGNGLIFVFLFVYVISSLNGINKTNSQSCFGVLTFMYLGLNFIINLPAQIDGWVALWYATDYSMGVGSRFFIGTVLKLFYNDFLDAKVAYNFCFVCILVIIVLVSYISNVLFCGCKDEYKIAFSYIWLLLMVSPGSVVAFWQSGNYGRLETYGFLIGLVCFIVYGKMKNDNLAFAIITILSCLSMAIYQGNIFMYYSFVLMIFIWEILSSDNKKRKRGIIWGSINMISTSTVFVFFQFFSNTIYGDASEMSSALANKTDLPIIETVIDLELFEPISVAFNTFTRDFLLGNELPRERTLITFILLCPIVIMFTGLYLKCLTRIKQGGNMVLVKTPYIYFILLVFTIIPQFLLNVDWGRWMICTNIVLFSGFLFLIWKHDEEAVCAITCLNGWIKEHKLIAIFVAFYIASLGKFNGRSFISQVNSITDWLVSNEWLVVK